jgi:2-C-methyl-D-erythritol 4-phosphate cytidylyltransferase
LSKIVIVLNNTNISRGQELVRKQAWSKVVAVCLGGKRRQDSVREGLKRLKECEWVIIHDGARPFITIDLLDTGLKSAIDTGAAVAAVPIKDTIKLSNNSGIVTETLQRNHLWAIQTPQIFQYDTLVKAYEHSDDDVTDDASLVEKSGGKVRLYMGSYRNIKITTPEDWELAEILARGQ